MPSQLFDLAPEIREPIIKELQIPANVSKCCSLCLTRVRQKMGAHLLGNAQWTDDEVRQFREQLQEIGPRWIQMSEQSGKPANVLKTFYFHYKKKYGFDQAVNEYYKNHANEDRRPITDGDESDVSVTSSDDETDFTRIEIDYTKSDFFKNMQHTDGNVKNESLSTQNITTAPLQNLQAPKDLIKPETPSNQSHIDDRLLPPASQLGQPPPLLNSQQIQNLSTSGILQNPQVSLVRTKKHSEDYDSSATETADEENESPANRQSPKTSAFAKSLNPATTISMVPSLTSQQNGPPSNVHDVMLNVIERTLKSTVGPPKHAMIPPLKSNQPPSMQQASNSDNSEITFVGSYRHEGPNKIQIQPQRRPNSEGHQPLATLSIVNSGPSPGQLQPPTQQIIGGHPLSISSIAATITPVPPLTSQQQQQNQQRPSSNPQHMSSMHEKDMKNFQNCRGIVQPNMSQQSEPEPQTLDLSIKKPQQHQQQERVSFSSPSYAKSVPPPPTGGSVVYRGDPGLQAKPFMAMYPDMNRHPTKSPSNYMPPLSPGQRQVMGINPHTIQQQQQQQQQQSNVNKSKIQPKLSPKMHQQQQSSGPVQQMNGPKGSITLGTPLMDNRGQPIMIQNAGTNQSPRFDILRQTPPSSDKIGSITAGTPILQANIHHLMEPRVREEFLKANRHSPAANQPNVSSAATGSPHPSQQFTPPYRPAELSNSTRELIFSDYLTSQQMQGHNTQPRGANNMTNTINIISGPAPGVRSDKESPSPRSMAHSNSPASMYYAADKERERAGSGQTRTEYLSRSSPADHHNRYVSLNYED